GRRHRLKSNRNRGCTRKSRSPRRTPATTSTTWKPTATSSTRTSSSKSKRGLRFGHRQRLAHRREAAPVLRTRAVRAQRRQVRGCRIALVQVEAVLGPGLVQLAHEAVAGDL